MADRFSDVIAARVSPRPPAEASSVRQLSSLYKLLSEPTSEPSDRAIVYGFAEALAVWADVEIRAYLADLAGRYSLAVSLPGSDPGAAPSGFDTQPLPEGTRIRRLSAAECDEFGFQDGEDVVLATVGARSPVEWVLAASSVAGLDVEVQLPPYLDALEHALSNYQAIESSRLTWALMQHFIQLDYPEEAARAAVAEVSTYIDAPVHLVAFGSRGLTLFAGDHAALLASRKAGDLLSVPVAAPAGYTAVVGARQTAGRSFGHRDVRCLHTAASALATWLPQALSKAENPIRRGERRIRGGSFDQVVERQSAHAAAQQDDISLLVIGAREGALAVEAAQRWIARIREYLRPTDLAGRLSSGEVGVLLTQTPHDGARIVGRRLTQLLKATDADSGELEATINLASRSPDTFVCEPLRP